MELEAKHKFEERSIVASNEIDTGIGKILWGANNLTCTMLMEEIERLIQEKTAHQLLTILQSL